MAHFDQLIAFRPEEFDTAADFHHEATASRPLRDKLIDTRSRDLRVRERAYLLWEGAGRPHGTENDHWLQAAREIDAERAV